MWRHFLAAAAFQLVAGDVNSDCAVAQSLPEEVGARLVGDDQASPAIGLVQTFLKYRLREERPAAAPEPASERVIVNGTFAGVEPLNPYRLRMVAGACPLSQDLGVEVPLSVVNIAKLQAFQAMGFIQALPHCGLTSLNSVSEMVAPGENVYQRNRLAKNLAVAWAVIGFTLMLWSFVSVAVVPRKGTTGPIKKGLADDHQAYSRGLLHYISLGWVDELVGRYGKCAHAVIEDTEIICKREDNNFEPYVKFKHHWDEEVKKAGSVEKAWITRALYRTVGWRACCLMLSLCMVEQLSGSIFMVWGLNLFLSSLEDLDTFRKLHPDEQADYLTPTIMILIFIWGTPMLFRATSIIATLVEGHYTQICASGLASVVFDKALRTPAGSVREEQQRDTADDEEPDPMGQHKPNLVQILNVDIVDCWGNLIADGMNTITAPLSAIGLLVMMIHQIGDSSATVGASYVLPVIILSLIATAIAMRFWKRYQVWLDKRMKWLTETLISIRTIKALAWERLSYDKLSQAREGELQNAKWMLVNAGFMTAIQHTLPWGVLLITIWFAEKKGSVPPRRLMIMQRLIGALLANVGQVSNGITRLMTVPNSFNRIKRFLAQPDKPKDVVRQPQLQTQNAPALRVSGSFTFGGTKAALKHLDVAIPKGELVGVIGRVGSGKTTFLQTIIGELYPLEHSFVEAPDAASGHVAYCSQVPWIFEGTLRENIITKSAMHQERYYSCIYAAGLAPDLQILPGGDQVTIGSFGIRLSGGQRARVALARAAYMEAASLVLMDDPFASVDAPTGNHIFHELLLGSPLRGRTRIVVTQPDKSRLQHFDRLLLFEDGEIVEMGPPAEVMETEAFKRIEGQVEEANPEDKPIIAGSVGRPEDAMTMVKQANEAGSLLREEEVREDITWRTCWWWVQTAGWVNLFVFVSAIFLQAIVEMRESLVLAVWVDAKVAYPDANDGVFMTRMIIVVLCCCAAICISFAAVANTALGAARSIHQQVMSSLLKAPVDRFFDKQPVGRLINRLSFDMKQVDETFMTTLFAMFSMLAGMTTTNLFILWVMPRSVAFLSFPIYGITFYFVYLYRGIAVPLVFHGKHSLSSVQDLQAVVVSQCISIRSNGMMDNFMVRYNHYSQSVIRCQYLIYYVCRAWAQSRVFLCFGILAAYFALGGLWSGVSMGVLATCISFAFFQMSQFETLCMVFTHLLNVLNALQRLSRYVGLPEEAADDLPNDFSVLKRAKIRRAELVPLQMRSEAKPGGGNQKDPGPLQVCVRGGKPILRLSADGKYLEFLEGCSPEDLAPGCKALQGKGAFHIVAVNSLSTSAEQMARELCTPPAVVWLDFWSSDYNEGLQVQIEDLTAGYGNAKSVLHGISLNVAPRTKCAFVGKTGCGKSTTLLCLLRFLEPRQGRLLIGGRDTTKLGLRALRQIVGLVPQDPTVFEGTIRFNIDPFDEFPDARLWEALQSVQLMPYIRMLPDGIDTYIERDGSNVSFGQKQLLSLARMVVRQPPVLLLDECTSALDPTTQEAAQKTILKDFPRTTTIAVAHRLETIMSFDQVVVFDEGLVIESGTVEGLRKVPDGAFSAMLRAKAAVSRDAA